MGAVAGCAVHFSLFIEGKNFRYLYLCRRGDANLVFSVVMYLLARIHRRAVMAGKAHVGIRRGVCTGKGSQVSAPFFIEEGVDPAVVADGAFFGRIRLQGGCGGCVCYDCYGGCGGGMLPPNFRGCVKIYL